MIYPVSIQQAMFLSEYVFMCARVCVCVCAQCVCARLCMCTVCVPDCVSLCGNPAGLPEKHFHDAENGSQ